MKKFMVALAIAGLSTAAFAEETEPVYSVCTNSFWSNWFVQANYSYGAYYSSQEANDGNQSYSKSPFKDFRGVSGFSIGVGKWFTPGLGLRIKLNGPKGQQVGKGVYTGNTGDPDDVEINHWLLQGDALFNITNMIWGYKEDRVYNFIPYVGAGATRYAASEKHGGTWTKSYNLGLMNTFRINKYLTADFELGWSIEGNKSDGIGKEDTNRGYMYRFDKVLNAELGLIVNVGRKGWQKAYSQDEVDAIKDGYDAQIANLNNQLADANSEIARLKDELAKKPKEVIIKEVEQKVISAPQSIFFNCGSARVTSEKETVNLQAIADAAKANGSKVYVTGYADSATGTPSINQKLSEKRAETIASKLEKCGLDRSQMVIEAKGGVDILKKNSYNRRVIVELK